jgi:hypothetical protein
MRRRGISVTCVTWGGNQNAGDGGVDVRVTLPSQLEPEGSIPRSKTVFQVKAEDTPPSGISLRPDDSLTIRKMALSIGFQDSVSFLLAIQATGLWLLPW